MGCGKTKGNEKDRKTGSNEAQVNDRGTQGTQEYRGVTRRNREDRGVTRRNREDRGVTRRNREDGGVTRRNREDRGGAGKTGVAQERQGDT